MNQSDKKSPAFQFYPKDWLDFKVQRMTDSAQGVYIRLLCHIWIGTNTQFSIQNDDKKLSKALGVSLTKWRKIKLQIQQNDDPLLVEEEGFLVSKRLKKEKEYQQLRHEQTSAASRKRWSQREMQTDMQTPSDAASSPHMREASPPSPTPSPYKEHIHLSSDKTPTQEMIGVFILHYKQTYGEDPKITPGKDGASAKRLWAVCLKVNPTNPMDYYRDRVDKIWKAKPDIRTFCGIEMFWNWGADKKESATPAIKEPKFIPYGEKK